ncbi:MAG: hypothetical protein ABDH49_08260 [Candidatus Hydrothermales bacterium]
MSLDPWVWISAFLTLAIFSFLFKDNPVYKFAEHLFVGVSAGYYASIYWHNAILRFIIRPLSEKFSTLYYKTVWPEILPDISTISAFLSFVMYLVPLAFGLLFFSLLFPKYSWLTRYPIAFLMGIGSGLSLYPTFKARIFDQIKDTFLPQFSQTVYFLNSLIIFIGTFSVLSYFFFSREQKGLLKVLAKFGIIFIMIGFGAAFGYTVMARISLLIGRFYFLIHDFIHLI